jgi:hypothetical protein
MEVVQTDCNADFMQHVLPSLAWPAVLEAAAAVGMSGVPETLSPEMLGECSTGLYCALLCSTVLGSTVLYWALLGCALLGSTGLYWAVLGSIVVSCVVMYYVNVCSLTHWSLSLGVYRGR